MDAIVTTCCGAVHPKLHVFCGLPSGHYTEHCGKVGSTSIIWTDSTPDEGRTGKISSWIVAGLLIAGSILIVACLVVSAAGP